uniref:SRS domain-containing protein n=1 Tax=Neospora caninum (strain Liverpool) TaxID=572307 RepID=F0JB64_NEOCL|nr:SRS domain-containing protein [Neospora caninum Liverpool]CEL71331.1 TPA: SRS domain-containing protein [Neospora caninum Liverpool]
MAALRFDPTHRWMAGALFLVVVLFMSSTVLVAKVDGEEPSQKVTCNATAAASGGISVSVDQKTKMVSFFCGTDMSQLQPSQGKETVTAFYTKKQLGDLGSLEDVFGQGSQATVATPSEDGANGSEVTLTLKKLPERMTTIYFSCTKTPPSPPAQSPGQRSPVARVPLTAKPAAENCVVTVTVPADPAANSKLQMRVPDSKVFVEVSCLTGAQESRNDIYFNHAPCPETVYSNKQFFRSQRPSSGPLHRLIPCGSSCMCAACTVEKQSMELDITSESKSVSFHCDTNVDELSPTEFSDKILDESCEEQVTLAEKLSSATLTKAESGYTFSVEELPETAATFCYKCSAPSDSDHREVLGQNQNTNACTVKIQVSAALPDGSSSASARTGSVLALVLGVAASVSFLPFDL